MEAATTIKKLDAWQVAIVLMAALPSIFVLATWDSDGLQTPQAFAVRYLSLPVTLCELSVIYLAVRAKFDVITLLKSLGNIPRLLITAWFVFALIPVVLLSGKALFSAFVTLQYALHGIFLAAAVHLARNSRLGIDSRAWSVTIVALGALSYVGLISAFALLVPNKEAFPWVLRLPSGTNIRQLGYFAALAAVPPLSMIMLGRSKIPVYCLILIAVVTFIAWSGSRGALIGLSCSAVFGAMMLGCRLSLFRMGLAILCFGTAMVISLKLPVPAPEFGLIRMVSSLEQEDIGTGRTFVWKSTISEISKGPWIGHGSGSFNRNMRETYGFDFNHPHQFILQYFYDWGVIGGGVGGLLLIFLFLSCLQLGRQHKDAAAYTSITSLCTIAAVGMIDGALFYPLSIFLAIMAVACGFVSRPAEK